MSGTSFFAAKNITCICAAIPLLHGLAEGTCIKITPIGDLSTSQKGADGHVTIIQTDDPRWEVEITFMYGSPHNEQFSALFAIYANTHNGEGIGSFLLKDLSGVTLFAFKYLIPVSHPGTEHGSEPKERTWKFLGIGNMGAAISGGNSI